VRNTSAGLIEAGQLVRTQVPYPANVRFEMKNLKADTIYRIELRAHNVIGFSAPAEILLRTAKGQFFYFKLFSPLSRKKNISFLSHHFLFFIKL
jgi:neurocan core protein